MSFSPLPAFLAIILAVLPISLARDAEARRYAAIVVDHETGEVLHARKADTLVYPASLTKMMTLYMLFETLDNGKLKLSSKLPVSQRAEGMPASRLGLKRGSSITVEDAIKALATKSANDVAVVVAEALGKTESRFAVQMTKRGAGVGHEQNHLQKCLRAAQSPPEDNRPRHGDALAQADCGPPRSIPLLWIAEVRISRSHISKPS